MTEDAVQSADGKTVEAVLREELSRGDAAARTALPVLRHLVTAQDSSLFSEDIIARIRGMIASLVGGFLDVGAGTVKRDLRPGHSAGEVGRLRQAFLDKPAMLSHLHGIALEWQLTERLQVRSAVDPVLPPLLQRLIAAPDPAIRDAAMKFVAAQARWCQSQRHMTLSPEELPEDLFHAAYAVVRSHLADVPAAAAGADAAEAALPRQHDESTRRIDLAANLITMLGNEKDGALSIDQAGVALFLTALARASREERDMVIFSTPESQAIRLSLSLCSAGLDKANVERQFLVLHPDVVLPSALGAVDAQMAAAILSTGYSSD